MRWIARLRREGLKMTQAQLAQILGVHAMTVSKWERGELRPTRYQVALLGNFKIASELDPEAGARAVEGLEGGGAVDGLYRLL